MPTYTLGEIKEKGYKKREAWWTVFITDPMAARALYLTVNYTKVTPNQLTLIAFIIGLGSAWFFYMGSRTDLIIGALLYHTAFMVDCMDGKTARIKGLESNFGAWLDYVADRWRVAVCTIAMMGAQFRITGDSLYLYLAFLVMFLDMLRYVDALQIWRQRRHMRAKIQATRKMIKQAIGAGLQPNLAAVEVDVDADDDMVDDFSDDGFDRTNLSVTPERVDLQAEFTQKFGWYVRVRTWLQRHRIRPHLMSGIEYQLFVLIVAPLSGFIVEVVLGASALLFFFEIAVIYKLWLSNADMNKQLDRMVSRAREKVPDAPLLDPAGFKKASDLLHRLEAERTAAGQGPDATPDVEARQAPS